MNRQHQQDTVVLYTGLGVGHLGPMAELAKLLIHRHSVSTAIDIVFLESPATNSDISSFVDKITSSNPSVTFHIIPAADIAGVSRAVDSSGRISNSGIFTYLTAANANLRAILGGLHRRVRALVVDFFFTDALDVASEVGIPSFILFASGVSALNTFLYLKNLRVELRSSVEVRIPGLPPIPRTHLPDRLTESLDDYDTFADRFGRFLDADGILVNSFSSLESAAIEAASGGLCVAGSGRRMNPVHCIGPMIAGSVENRGSGDEKRHECLEWLDSLPEKSVVFLCFGSMGAHSGEQLTEIAIGLERSGQRFLWSVRNPRDGSESSPELEKLLPEGFLERTSGRGMVVKSWAPQVEVMRHEATGGFVTHCGWNSTLEAVVAGVPMIGWPMYAEQRINLAVLTAEELRLAVPMKGYDEGVVPAAEVEERVRWLMESEGGRELRERAAAAKNAAREAMEVGGGSYEALAAVAAQWK